MRGKALVVAAFLAMGIAFAQSEPDVMARAIDAFTNGRFPEAALYFEQAVRKRPGSFEAHFLLGATLTELERTSEAIDQLEQAHRLEPAHVDALKLLAAQYMIRRDYAKAIRALNSVAAPDEETSLLLIESYQSSGDSARSFAFARRSLARFPMSPRIHCWLGFQLQFSGRYEEAREHLEEAVRLAPDYPATYYVLADVLLKQQKYESSIPYFQKAIQLLPADVEARIGLSQAWLGVGDSRMALETLLEAARTVPGDSRVHLHLSRMYFRLGDEPRAEQEAALSIKLREKETGVIELPAVLRSGPPRH